MLLQTENLTKEYGRNRALDNLTMRVGSGEIVGLLGPNGSGKSTALRLLLGFMRPTSGRASIAGHDCWHDSVAARSHVSYLPGELRLYDNMTGRQILAFLGHLRGSDDSAKTKKLADLFDIDLDRPLSQLSSGMKRKVALLQVLLPSTPLLVLDEPTNTLDPTMRGILLHQLKKARHDGQAVLFSSHVLGEVEQVCDRVGILQKGRLVHLQTMAELREAKLVRVCFGEKVPQLPNLIGLNIRQQHGQEVVLEYSGLLPPLLDWLARSPVVDLQIEPLGLAPLYHRYHGVEE
jgi:ABC-2 type transport system ATP-binding protein